MILCVVGGAKFYMILHALGGGYTVGYPEWGPGPLKSVHPYGLQMYETDEIQT